MARFWPPTHTGLSASYFAPLPHRVRQKVELGSGLSKQSSVVRSGGAVYDEEHWSRDGATATRSGGDGHAEGVAARSVAGWRAGVRAARTRAAGAAPGASGIRTDVADLRPSPVVHPAVHVGRAGAAGDLGPQARGPRAGSRRIPAHCDDRARDDDLRALPPARS